MQKASQRAAARLGSLQEQLTAVTQQKEETALQLSASREAEKQHAGALANLKVVLAEWMQKADGLEGKLRSLQGRLERAQAASRLQEEQIGELQRQDEARQEVLEDVQKKWTDLVSTLEGKADKALLRKLFTDALQSARHERREAFRRMGSTLGVEREAMEQLLQEEQGGLTGWVTGRLGSRSAPDTPRRPSQQSELKSSFSELWVNFLEAESRGASPPRQLPAQPRKRPEAPARKRLAKNVPALLRPALAATPRRSDGNPCSPAVSLIDPPGPGTGGSGHLLLDAVTDVVPRGTPWLLPPAKSAAGLLQGLSKP
nr:thyroid receptor-interacting protein 11-like [Equus asinus]